MHISPQEIQKIIGHNIIVRREIFDMDQNVLADVLKISPEQVKQIEEGTLELSLHQLFTLARFFNCSIDALCGFRPIDESFTVSLVAALNILDRELSPDFAQLQNELRFHLYRSLKTFALAVNVAQQKADKQPATLPH